jgi:hypothetical protein
MKPSVGFLRRLFGELGRAAKIAASQVGRVPCPECGNGTPWAHVVKTGQCPFGHEYPSIVIKGGKAA